MKITKQLYLARIYDVLFSDLAALKWSEAWMALIFGFTLILCTAQVQAGDIDFFRYIIPLWIWALSFILYGVLKLVLVVNRRKWCVTRILATIIGLLMWSYIFVVAAIFTPFSVTDILFMMPILAESWFLAVTLGVKFYGIRTTSSK